MDKFSLKDSGRGDSEAGDSDCEMGRESPLLGEGFSELFTPDGHHRLHPSKQESEMLKKSILDHLRLLIPGLDFTLFGHTY